jgi:hypothetical protein
MQRALRPVTLCGHKWAGADYGDNCLNRSTGDYTKTAKPRRRNKLNSTRSLLDSHGPLQTKASADPTASAMELIAASVRNGVDETNRRTSAEGDSENW